MHGENKNMVLKSVSIGRGVSWITEAFPYFSRNPLGWIAAIIVFFILSIVFELIPFGFVIVNIFYPVIIGGYMLGCMAHYQGNSFEFQHLFAGFREPYFKRLTLLGVFYLIALLMIVVLTVILIIAILGSMEIFQQIERGQIDDVSAYTEEFLLFLLVLATLILPLIMAMWFAPAIIIQTDKAAHSAMILSFNACMKNILPFTLYGLVVLILAIIAAIPLLLGYLVLLPVLSASVYVAFLDCFEINTADSSL